MFCVLLQRKRRQKVSYLDYMALNTNKNLKLFYSIKEVASQFGVTESLLRFWEKQFPSISPKKNAHNVRQYTEEDIAEIRTVYNLVKVRGMKISSAQQILAKNNQGAKDNAVILLRLQSIRDELLFLKQELGE